MARNWIETFNVGRAVLIRMSTTWASGTVTQLDGRHGVTVTLDRGVNIYVHPSVIWRDVRVAGARS